MSTNETIYQISRLTIKPISFVEIEEYWQQHGVLHDAHNGCEEVQNWLYYDGINHPGGNNNDVYSRSFSMPYFYGAFLGGCIVGANTIFRTTTESIRSRGLCVNEEQRGNNIGSSLLEFGIKIASIRYPQADYIWSIPSKDSIGAFAKAGFTASTGWFEEHTPDGHKLLNESCYAYSSLHR